MCLGLQTPSTESSQLTLWQHGGGRVGGRGRGAASRRPCCLAETCMAMQGPLQLTQITCAVKEGSLESSQTALSPGGQGAFFAKERTVGY